METSIVVKERVWVLPPLSKTKEDPFVFNGFESEQFFGNDKPVYIEYCSGNGLWIAKRALENCDVNWVAVEMKGKRMRKIRSKIQRQKLSNLVGVMGEAEHLTTRFLQSGSIGKVFINFPDPWPKLRHKKHRLVSEAFIVELSRILKSGGEVTVVTDDENYSNQVIEYFGASKDFSSLIPLPYFRTEVESYGTSSFEDLWRKKEKTIRYHQYKKVIT